MHPEKFSHYTKSILATTAIRDEKDISRGWMKMKSCIPAWAEEISEGQWLPQLIFYNPNASHEESAGLSYQKLGNLLLVLLPISCCFGEEIGNFSRHQH